MNRIIMVCAVLNSLLLILPIPANAAPVIDRDWAFIDNRPADDIFGFTGLTLNLTVRATESVLALTGPGSGATVLYNSLGFPFVNPHNVPLNAVFPISGGAEFTALLSPLDISQFPNVEGTYTFTVTNMSSQSAVITSHNLDKPEVIDLPTNLAFSDNSTTPVFTFTDPDPSPNVAGVNRRYQVDIFDASKANIFQSNVLLTTSFAVPIGILDAGQDYFFRAVSLDFDPSELIGGVEPPINSRVENRAIAYAPFQTAVPEPSTMLLIGSGLIGLAGYGRRKFLKK